MHHKNSESNPPETAKALPLPRKYSWTANIPPQEQHREHHQENHLWWSSNTVFVGALRKVHKPLVQYPPPVEGDIQE